MEDDAVVEAALHQRLDLRDMLWRPVRTKPNDDLAVLGRQDDGVVRVRRGPGGWSGKKRKRQRGATAEKEHAWPQIAAAGSPARRDSRLKAHCNRRAALAAISQPAKKVLDRGLTPGIFAWGQENSFDS